MCLFHRTFLLFLIGNVSFFLTCAWIEKFWYVWHKHIAEVYGFLFIVFWKQDAACDLSYTDENIKIIKFLGSVFLFLQLK